MEETSRAFLKWTLAIIILAGVCIYALQNVGDAFSAGIAFGDPSESESASPPLSPVQSGQALPQTDFALIANAAGFFTSDGMSLGPGPQDGFVLSFPMIEGDPNCVQTARVEIPIRFATPAQLALYPSAIPDLAAVTDGGQLAEPIQLQLTTPPVVNTEANPGVLSWDVGQLYRNWATGEPFEGTTPGPTDPTAFTVIIRPYDQGAPDRRIDVPSLESPDPRPLFIWEGAPNCPTGGSEVPTAVETAV